MKTVIMAGGRGTRISSIASNIPKPMIQIGRKPVLEHEILCLQKQGFRDIIITVSHLAEQIINFFGNGEKLGVNIEYFIEQKPLGNAGALFKLKKQLNEDFLLLNADAVFDIDFERFVAFHKKMGGLVTLFTHPNSHPYDSGLIISDDKKCVQKWINKEDIKPQWYKNRVNAGIHVINPLVLAGYEESVVGTEVNGRLIKVDLDRDILKPLCGIGKMHCYDSSEYIKDVGTPDRYEAVCKDFAKGIIKAKNLKNKQKAVFIDRDGTINKYAGFLSDIRDFELLPGVARAIRTINESGYLAIVVTNQPVIARGEVTFVELEEIHNKMETLLGREGAYLDGIYFCPHHPDQGFIGEISELKINCNCRKPKPGMLLKAAEDFNIDLSRSWMIGDGKNDVLAGKSVGCKTSLIFEKNIRNDLQTPDFSQDITVDSLWAFAEMLE